MRTAPDFIDERPGAAAIGPGLASALDAAIRQRAPFLTAHLPFLSRVARFLCVGLVGLAVDSGVFALFYNAGAGAPLSRAASLFVATIVTWALNRAFTFAPSGRTPLAEMARYFGVALVAQGFNYLVFLALHYATGEAHPYACLVASAAMTAAFSFTGQSLFAFAQRTDA